MFKKTRLLSWVAQIGLITSMIKESRLALRLFRDKRVPTQAKAIPVLAVLAIVSPLGWVVNLVPIVGQLSSLGLLALGVNTFIKAAPQDIVQEYMTELRMEPLQERSSR
jgi:uncharacterized membrane protein YkvA (DUF1232 family)